MGTQLPQRKFMPICEPRFNDNTSIFRVVSFNVMPKNNDYKNRLQQGNPNNASPLQGLRTRPDYYSWGHRGNLLVEEIKRSKPDIICLQGCNQFEHFQEKLSPMGFMGIYEQTQKPHKLEHVYFGDGLAVFWRNERFKLTGRKRIALGDPQWVSNIALCARLKRHDPYLKATSTQRLQNAINREYETSVQVSLNGKPESKWMVLSDKFLYLFHKEKQYVSHIHCYDLDEFEEINETSDDLNDHSFAIIPKESNKKVTEPVRFYTNNPAVTTEWIKKIKDAQIGTEIDVWTSQLIHGYSINTEFRRIKQCKQLLEQVARVSATDKLGDSYIGGGGYMRKGISKKLEIKAKKETPMGKEELAEMFRKKMMLRIAKQDEPPATNTPSTKAPGKPEDSSPTEMKVIDPNVKEEESKEEPANGGKVPQSVLDAAKEPAWQKSGKWQVPTVLQRPVIMCIDIESNAWGDAMHEVPPLVYTYLTRQSRTTTHKPLYQHSLQKLEMDPASRAGRHSWCLQSAYALGLGEEPEMTAFSRYWPDDGKPNMPLRLEDYQKLNFGESVEIIRCTDLVLFSPQDFRVLKLQQAMAKEWVYTSCNRSLPNADYPSDHTMIGVEFEMAYKNKAREAMIRQAQSQPQSVGASSQTTPAGSVMNGGVAQPPAMNGNMAMANGMNVNTVGQPGGQVPPGNLAVPGMGQLVNQQPRTGALGHGPPAQSQIAQQSMYESGGLTPRVPPQMQQQPPQMQQMNPQQMQQHHQMIQQQLQQQGQQWQQQRQQRRQRQ